MVTGGDGACTDGVGAGGDAGLGDIVDADDAAATCGEPWRADTCDGATNAFGPRLFLLAVT